MLDRSTSKRCKAAVKKARERQRARDGLAVFAIETHHHRLIDALLISGRLDAQRALDRKAIEAELAEVIAEWVARWLEK
jgi:hypothetical protein